MADAGEISVTLTVKAEEFKKALDGSKKNLEDFGKKTESFFSAQNIAIGAAIAAVGKFAKDSVAAYIQSENANARLTQALANQGLAIEENVTRMNEQALALQQVTGVEDDAIISGQALLTTFGLQGAQMEKATQAALDLSAATGMDLQSAFMAMSKAAAGNMGALTRYIGEIDSSLPKQEQFAVAVKRIGDTMGGAAANQAKTFGGQIQIMSANFNNLQEEIGKLIAGPGAGVVQWINGAILAFTTFMQTVNSTIAYFGGLGTVFQLIVIGALRDFMNALTLVGVQMTNVIGIIPGLGGSMDVLRQKIIAGNAEIQKRITWTEIEIEETGKAAAAAKAAEQTKVQAKRTAAVQEVAIIDGLSTYTSEMMKKELEERRKQAEEKAKIQQDWFDTFTTTEAEMNAFAIQETNRFFDGFGTAMADMIVDGKDFGESMKKVFKDMAKQIISYLVQMIAKIIAFLILREAARQFGGAYGQASAAAMTAAANATDWGGSGMASGGMINEPSIITGLRSGRSHMAGEAGPEAVVPFGNVSNAEMAGGGGITINISGHFIQGDDASWQRLMRERIVPEIRRFTMASPVGPFNRRRGIS